MKNRDRPYLAVRREPTAWKVRLYIRVEKRVAARCVRYAVNERAPIGKQ